MHPILHIDLLGRPIQPGDYIAYAAQNGDSPAMRLGQVIELKWKDEPYRQYVNNDWVQVYDKTPKIFTKSYRHNGWGSGRQKNVTLGFLDKIIVLPAESVPQDIKDALNGEIGD